ncbi:hypothetical protein ABBQ32_006007 [Trebouxia sp. C0010 RCD-2024]
MERQSRQVKAGVGTVEAAQMVDSTPLLLDGQNHAAKERLARDGYLLLRNFLPADRLSQAHAFLLNELHRWKPDSCTTQGMTVAGKRNLGLLQRQDLAAAAPVKRVLEALELFELMETLMQVPQVLTSGYKWLRAVSQGEFTGVHIDKVFLGRGSPRVLTAWVPLGQVDVEDGAMMVCRGSHRMRSFAKLKAGYGQSQVGADGTQSGWYSDNGADLAHMINPHAVDWRTTDFKAGDIVVLSEHPHYVANADTIKRPSSYKVFPSKTGWLQSDSHVCSCSSCGAYKPFCMDLLNTRYA